MAGSLQPRVKTWTSTEDVTAADLNAEFDNCLTAMQPLLVDDYSTNVAQMQVQTDPGESGSESLATTLAGEIARLRFMINELTGKSYWYQSPVSNIEQLSDAIGGGLPANRVSSGAASANSLAPRFLIPNGSAATLVLDCSPTAFVYSIASTQYSLSTDVTITGLSTAPSSSNTCLVNTAIYDTVTNPSQIAGMYGSYIPYDNAGSEITALDGKLAAFSITNGSAETEYFTAYVDNANSRLAEVQRGFFFNSSSNPVRPIIFDDNDTITLLRLTWVFARADGTLDVTYNQPVISDDQPAAPSTGDYWFDLGADLWYRRTATTWENATATHIGWCAQTTTACVAARGVEFFSGHDAKNDIQIEYVSATQVRTTKSTYEVRVYGQPIRVSGYRTTWDITADLQSGISESASTMYYAYITNTGDKILSDIAPLDQRPVLRGFYHPHESWRYVGAVRNDGSSNFTSSLVRSAPGSQSPLRTVNTATGVWYLFPGLSSLDVTAVGGGGGSGGANSASSEGTVSGGGGGGGTSIKRLTAGFGAAETVTVGAGGTAGANTGTAGGTGGTSSFGSHCSAAGGTGGDVLASGTAAARSGAPGSGGAGSGGDINLTGSSGVYGFRSTASIFVPSSGGSSSMGGGGLGGNASVGQVGGPYGGGAGGSSSTNNTDFAGAVGGDGVVILSESY